MKKQSCNFYFMLIIIQNSIVLRGFAHKKSQLPKPLELEYFNLFDVAKSSYQTIIYSARLNKIWLKPASLLLSQSLLF